MSSFLRDKHVRVFLLAALAAFMIACSNGEDGEADGEEDPHEDGTPVRVAEVELRTVDEVERSIGTVETFSRPVVAAEVSGRVKQVEADVGDEVSEGDTLARLDAEPFELGRDVARAEVGRLEARTRQLEMDLQRMERLSERDYATEQDKDSVRAELDATREQLNSARSQFRQAERDLRLTRITAPLDGVVDERMVSEGGFISSGEPAFRIQPRDRFRAVVSFPDRVGERLETGMEVSLRPRGGRSGEASGEITRLRPAVDPDSRSVRAIVDFENPGNWRAGMTVEARVVVERREEALTVPANSLVQRAAGRVVYVLDGDNEVSERRVDVGVRTTDWVEIRDGLEAGEKVVTDGANFLTDAARVRVREDD